MSEFVPTPPISLYITDIVEGSVVKEGDERFRWVLITYNGEKVYKVRINGTIIQKYHSSGEGEKKSFTSLTLNDSTSTIRMKGWEENAEFMNEFDVGNEVEMIGKPRLSEDEIYVLPEQILKIEDFDQELYLRIKKVKRYLKKEFELPTEKQQEKKHTLEQKGLIFNVITDEEEGIELDEILERTKIDRPTVESVIQDLLNDGDIYEPSTLKFKKI
ncbi:MAG: hypothetical protein KAS63_00110 [Candidatus Heimdallarchaeota archaeon]|nr:hypothetical protein [Candidatus Heimdallarchaeota archaeon]MCK4953746.1 hypothetical protein [Candidatus Heimdallarchaeota archaeon]